MKKKKPIAQFNFSYAALEQLGDKADEMIERDMAELAAFEVDAAYRADLAAKTDAVKEFPTDEELLGDATEATEQKDLAADELRVGIRNMMVRVKQVFKLGTASYNRFGTSGLDKMTDNNLVRCGRRVERLATKYLVQLAPKGVTVGLIADLAALVTVLDEAIDAQDSALRARNSGTQERTELGNALYENVVELFDFGKDHWYTRDEAKYNDYVIYNSPGGGANPPDNSELTGTVSPMSTVNVASGVSPNATLTVTNTGMVPFIFCTTLMATDPCAVGQTVNPAEEVTVTGGTAAIPPFNPFLNITNNDPMMAATYKVMIA